MNYNSLSGRQKRYLRGLGHHLTPAVWIGEAGCSQPLLAEAEGALQRHELIKVKLSGNVPQSRQETGRELAQRTDAHLVQILGHTLLLYRPADEPKIRLPATGAHHTGS